jgi:hypothetical protein
MGGGGIVLKALCKEKKRGQELGIDCTALHKVTFTFRCEQLAALLRRAMTHKQAFYFTE